MVTERRGKNVAVIGAVLHLIFTAVMVTMWLWTESLAAMAVSITLGGGVLVWLMVALLFYCRQLADQERIEVEELTARGADAGALFDRGDASARPAAARADMIERWILPIFALVWAVDHATIAIFVLRYLAQLEKPEDLTNLLAGMGFQVLVGFPMFLFSWYAVGMARGEPAWRPLRACGSYMLGNVLFVAMVLAALVGARLDYPRLDVMMAHVVPAVQLILAAELVMNFVLDLYRPRVGGQDRRLSIDSRLLDLLADPKRVGHSIAELLNYQFGYEVSKTWFYQLVSKAFVPLVIFGVALMFALSGVVVVQDGEQAVVLHWGKLDADRATLGPGIHLKWPWPIDTARRFRVDTVHRVLLGAGEQRSREQRAGEFVKDREILLWTQEHGEREELNFVLAIPPKTPEARREGGDETPPVNIIKLVVLVEYMISDVRKYGYQYTDPQEMLRLAAHREMSTYCASATLDEPVGQAEADRPEAIMTFGRERAAQELKKRIQARADGLNLGVRLTYVGLVSVHPPAEAAPEFEKVLETERRRDETRFKAEGEAHEILARVAGSAEQALSLSLAISVEGELEVLRKARGNAAQFRNKLPKSIRGAKAAIDEANQDIERDRLLGKTGPGKPPTLAQRMRIRHREHLALLERIESDPATFPFDAEIAAARKRSDKEFDLAVGEPAAEVAKAEAARWETELAERGRYEAVQRERVAWRVNPQVYMWDRWLDVWDEALPGMLKYVLGVDKDRVEVWLNWEREIGAMEDVTFVERQTPK